MYFPWKPYVPAATFHSTERRNRPRVTLDELSKRYGIAPEELRRWIVARRLLVHHNAEGRILWAELAPNQAPHRSIQRSRARAAS
jgi:poly-beta-1,6-N-acetyl-D-glucosamine biosynthesis protein PgaD